MRRPYRTCCRRSEDATRRRFVPASRQCVEPLPETAIKICIAYCGQAENLNNSPSRNFRLYGERFAIGIPASCRQTQTFMLFAAVPDRESPTKSLPNRENQPQGGSWSQESFVQYLLWPLEPATRYFRSDLRQIAVFSRVFTGKLPADRKSRQNP